MTTRQSIPNGDLLRMENIFKSFSGVPVLRAVRLVVASGEVHSLMGENGAGKSTLMKILSGLYRPDDGRIYIHGTPAHFRSPRDALHQGICMIHQELNPVRAMTVAENIFLGREPCHRFMNVVNVGKQRELTRKLFGEMGMSIHPNTKMGDLSVAEMQMVEIIKAISYRSKIIIMDEPTSAITNREAGKLFEIIRNLKSQGIAIIYISHKMDEVFCISDRITILRDGQYIGSHPARQLDQDTLVKLMVGREIKELFPKVNPDKKDVALEVKDFTRRGKFQNISFQVRKGEVLGFAGLVGAGRSEIMETLFGMWRADAGTVEIDGREVQLQSPSDAIRQGMALVTENRQLTGLNLKASIKFNVTLPGLRKFCRFGWILQLQKEAGAVDVLCAKLRLPPRNRNQLVNELSGGTQQKVVLAKWLLNDPRIIILDEPTRGIDIGAKAEVYRIIGELAQHGNAIILVSSEMPELLALCDRIIVLYHGQISGEFDRNVFDQERIIKAAMGNADTATENHNN